VGPFFASGVGEFDHFHTMRVMGSASDSVDGLGAFGVVEVTVNEQVGIGGGCKDVFDVFAQEKAFISAHEFLVGIFDGALGLQVGT